MQGLLHYIPLPNDLKFEVWNPILWCYICFFFFFFLMMLYMLWSLYVRNLMWFPTCFHHLLLLCFSLNLQENNPKPPWGKSIKTNFHSYFIHYWLSKFVFREVLWMHPNECIIICNNLWSTIWLVIHIMSEDTVPKKSDDSDRLKHWFH